ncbi:O-antigen ligase family protein, partial [Candidatus Microgenomates bacterium]|nr:O-antigen ligase family protein [Candidatus Microgenomates bacterium]
GIDKNLWVQDVQNRVFSTLGQPNWLAAYMAVLIPVTIGSVCIKYQVSGIKYDKKNNSNNSPFIVSLLNCLIVIFYLALLFTKSRSGFIGFWISLILLISSLLILHRKKFLRLFLVLCSLFFVLTFVFGCPISQLNKFTLPELIKSTNNTQATTNNLQPNYGSSVIDVGITESGVIRQIVWKGALDIFKNNPLFGTGVETFAFAYYRYRPVEHNMTSEWDFLYNKAHNEYLNYLATTGIFGFVTYLLFIGSFIIWNIKKFKAQMSNVKSNSKFKTQKNLDLGFDLKLRILDFGFFIGWLSILITNFFGFSVVIIQLFFFLIPAIVFVINNEAPNNLTLKQSASRRTNDSINNFQKVTVISLFFVICYMLFVLARLWYADTLFATGSQYTKAEEFTSSYESLKEAIFLNSDEPLYYDEFSYPAAQLAAAFYQDGKQATLASQLLREATLSSDMAILISPANINFWKTRTRVFYTLSQIDEKYFVNAKEALEMALELSPTDPKIYYNLAIIDDRLGKTQEAFSLLEKGAALKPDFRDIYFALGVMYEKSNQKVKARENYNYILTKINPNDEEVKKKMEELK